MSLRQPLLNKKKDAGEGGQIKNIDAAVINQATRRSQQSQRDRGVAGQEQYDLDIKKLQMQPGSLPPRAGFNQDESPMYSQDPEESILTEPEDDKLIVIPNLEDEQAQFREKDIAQKPTKIYLDHCNQYAKTNLIKEQREIQDYKFRYVDIENGLISSEVTERMTRENQQGISFNPRDLQDAAFARLFKTQTIKLFTDFIFIDNKQYLLVKTWQKVHYDMPSHDNLPTKGINSINSRNDPKAKMGSVHHDGAAGFNDPQNQQAAEDEERQSFYIKTLQVFDKNGEKLDDPILVEQVYGTFDSYRLYDISCLHYKDNLYFFKRLYKWKDDGDADEDANRNMAGAQSPGSKMKEKDRKEKQAGAFTPQDQMNKGSIAGSLDSLPGRKQAATEQQESEKDIERENMSVQDDVRSVPNKYKKAADNVKGQSRQSASKDRSRKQRTRLQLYRYDLRNGKEEKIEGIFIDEHPLAYPLEQTELGRANNQGQKQSGFNNKILASRQAPADQENCQFNVIFSREFGEKSADEMDKERRKDNENEEDDEQAKLRGEQDFLQQQYFCIQQYVMRRQQFCRFRIYKLDYYDREEGLFDRSMIFQSKLTNQEQSTDLNRQVQFLNNTVTTNELERPCETIHFLITNMFILIQIDIQQKNAEGQGRPEVNPVVEQYPRKYTDIFQKIWNSGGIIPQKAQINNNDDEIKEDKIDQYFFVDSRNEIQLLFPNTKQKVESLRRIEQINDQFKIKKTGNQQKNSEYKKIICIDYKRSREKKEFVNVVQNIEHLQKILDHQNMHQAQSLVFVKDVEVQILYITEPSSNVILFFKMDVQKFEQCLEIADILKEDQPAGAQAQSASEAGIAPSKTMTQRRGTLPGAEMPPKQASQATPGKAQGAPDKDNHKVAAVTSENCNIDNQMVSQGANSMRLQEETENRTKQTFITDLNHQEPYIQFRVDRGIQTFQQQRKTDQNDESKTIKKLESRERQDHVLIDDFQGNKVKIMTFRTETTEFSTIPQNLKLILYQLTNDKKHAMFLFAVYNVKMQGAGAQSELKIIKKSYILVRKTQEELQRIFQSKPTEELIKKNEQVMLIKSYFDISPKRFDEIQNYQFGDDGKNDDNQLETSATAESPFRDIELTLCSGSGYEKLRFNYIPFIYQERLSGTTSMIIVFDILQNRATEIISISPSQANLDYIYEDENGCNTFMLCRTSELHEVPAQQSYMQRAKYQVFTLYRERIGRIQGEEFLITHTEKGTKMQTIGQKQLLFSKDCMRCYDWEYIRQSKALPYKDENNVIKGCMLQLKTSFDKSSLIYLVDQEKSNIYFYRSDVVFTGQKKFQLSSKRPDQASGQESQYDLYIIAISTTFTRRFIELDIFDRSEAYTCLNIVQELILRLRTPDLEYIVLNSFEDLKDKDFFQSQLILQGKSICDICITDQKSVRKATSQYSDYTEYTDLKGSIIEEIIADDKIRRDALRETKFYPKQLMVQIDLNFMGTIGRAFYLVSYQSVKMLLEKIIEEIGTIEYQPFIMYDINLTMESKQVRINDFFEVDQQERKGGIQSMCNLEILIKNTELPQFSDVPFEFFQLSNQQIMQSNKTKLISNFLDLETEITQNIIEREEMKPANIERSYETEYYFIDYQMMIIDEKIRCVRQKKEIPSFDDLYFAEIIMKKSQDEINNSFFLQESVQKIINAQWDRTKNFQKRIFFIYFFFYCIPMCVSCFKISDSVDNLMFNIAFFPSIILLVIESIQINKDGYEYFMGWNLIDFSQLILFYFLFYLRQEGYDNDLSFFPLLKLFNILLAFTKMGFFVRIFEDYGFLVQMVIFVLQSLIPFNVVYLIFVLIFSICNVVLKLDIDEEVDEAQKLSYFQKTLLQTFRTGLGELGMPSFKTVMQQKDTFFRTMNVYLIWLLWFLTVFFLLIFMINFLIAVITSAYQRVMNYQKLIGFKHKADLNYETYMLISTFMELKQYRCLVLMSSTSVRELIEDEFDEKAEQFKKFIQRETTGLKQGHEKLNEQIEQIKKEQEDIEKFMHSEFDQLKIKRDEMQKDIFKVVESAQGVQR